MSASMQTSIFLARLIGPVMTLVGVSLLVNETAFRKMAQDFLRSPSLMFFSGMILMPAGLAIVLTHNVWVVGWPVLITISGWLALINGAVRLLTPQDAVKFARRVYRQPHGALMTGLVWIVTGAVLTFFGYLSEPLGVNP